MLAFVLHLALLGSPAAGALPALVPTAVLTPVAMAPVAMAVPQGISGAQHSSNAPHSGRRPVPNVNPVGKADQAPQGNNPTPGPVPIALLTLGGLALYGAYTRRRRSHAED